jgi:adenylate cyclase
MATTLNSILEAILEHPEKRTELIKEIHRRFSKTVAILVIDMCGFTRTMQKHGGEVLIMIHQLKKIALPIFAGHNGTFIKASADNLFCTFETVLDAVNAARELNKSLQIINRVLPSDRQVRISTGIGYGEIFVFEDDMFGHEMNITCKIGEDVAGGEEILLTESAAKQLDEPGIPQEITMSGVTIPYFVLT